MLNQRLAKAGMSKYRLSKISGIPYTTTNDLCRGKVDIRKCSVDTIYHLSLALGVTMEELLAPYYEQRAAFDLFRSNVCHQLKELGDEKYIATLLEKDTIRNYYERHWYPEALYLLAMLDYLCEENHLPFCEDYNDLRVLKLSEKLYPGSVIAMCIALQDDTPKTEAMEQAISAFLRHNIIECEVRDVT